MHVQIKGMHCSSCVNSLTAVINDISGVDNLKINLDSGSATIEGSPNKDTVKSSIESAGYSVISISEDNNLKKTTATPSNSQKSDLYKLAPLFIALSFISLIAWYLSIGSDSINTFMNFFMGIYFVVFGLSKIIDLKNFPKSFAMYDPIASNFSFYGWAYPFVELALGVMFIAQFFPFVAIVSTIILLSITTFGVIKVLISDTEIECACLGTWMKLPMTKATFIENFIMLFMAAWMLPEFF